MPQYPPPAVHPSASLTISWNTQAKRAPAPAPMHATVTAVDGTRITLRLRDGSTRRYVASQGEAAVLRTLVGQTIAFRVDSDR
ncbi:MAG TPA: hypothetical protein VFA29_05535 [Candidatus Baltobacteraceae bacterium]|nr:hypothetical protein [Candidatus Baltobacteraceae bacterium]